MLELKSNFSPKCSSPLFLLFCKKSRANIDDYSREILFYKTSGLFQRISKNVLKIHFRDAFRT